MASRVSNCIIFRLPCQINMPAVCGVDASQVMPPLHPRAAAEWHAAQTQKPTAEAEGPSGFPPTYRTLASAAGLVLTEEVNFD